MRYTSTSTTSPVNSTGLSCTSSLAAPSSLVVLCLLLSEAMAQKLESVRATLKKANWQHYNHKSLPIVPQPGLLQHTLRALPCSTLCSQ